MSLAIVTATLDLVRADACIKSWIRTAKGPIAVYVVGQHPAGLVEDWTNFQAPGPAGEHWQYEVRLVGAIQGVVPAFAIGVEKALEDGHQIIACFHDDLEITHEHWDNWVQSAFLSDPDIGLVGFGGATGLGDDMIYQTPYDPMLLVRKHFISNMRDAEAHGERVLYPCPVSVLDGFSQIGRREYWLHLHHSWSGDQTKGRHPGDGRYNLFKVMQEWGIVHHAYDAALGCFARRLGWEAWYIPIACHHHGGLTAVADPRYHTWANTQPLYRDYRGKVHTGDQAFWAKSHAIVYDKFTDVLPLRLPFLVQEKAETP